MKKTFIIIICVISLQYIQAQNVSLPIVYATGGEGKNVIYQKISAEERENMPGYVWGPCGQCFENFCNVKASSTLLPQGAVKYAAKNIQDDDPTTAWVEGDSEYGLGEYLEFKNAQLGSQIAIYNGYQKSPKSFIDNSRVKSLRVSENGIDRCIIRLKDEMGEQIINGEKLGFKFYDAGKQNITLRFTITEVYPGTKFKDVAISELFINGCCFAGNSKISLTNGTEKEISAITKNDSIKLIDNANNIIYASALEIGNITHTNVLEFITEKKRSIVVTPAHLMYAGSIQKKVQARALKIGDSLIIHEDNGTSTLEMIAQIHHIEKPTETFYFKKMEFLDKEINWPIRLILNNVYITDEYIEKLNHINAKK